VTKDPYRYFRIEAREILDALSRGLLELEKGGDQEIVRQLLRGAHTLKGAARVVKQPEIGDLAHRIEDLLAPHRNNAAEVERRVIDSTLGLVDAIRERMALLGSAPEVAGAAAGAAVTDDSLHSVRIGIDELDRLLEGISEAVAATTLLQREVERLRRAAEQMRSQIDQAPAGNERNGTPRFLAAVEETAATVNGSVSQVVTRADEVGRELAALCDAAFDLRLVPAQVLVIELERAARDAAQSLGKQVTFKATGTDTRIDAAVLSSLRGALRHVVLNAVAHGIEKSSVRVGSGKPASGVVELAIERRGHRAAVSCRDDGAGLDMESVRRAAVELGLISDSSARSLDISRLVELLLRGGVSTSRAVTDLSGRGIGLDVVRQTVQALKGELDIRSTEGQGTTVELVVPISLSSLPALAVEEGEVTAFVPLDSVRQTVRVKHQEILSSSEGERIVVDGNVIPFLPLARALGRPARSTRLRRTQTAVVLQSSSQLAAIGVERLRGIGNVVVRNLPEHISADAVIAGAALDEEGTPQLVLAPAAVVQAAAEARRPAEEPIAGPRLPLLVIDDSLTTRMLEQSILESAGYEVDLAVSGEDAIEKARRRRYALFIVDIEMPGMNGFEFIAASRADPALRDVPAILVTSRADPEDKRRGKDVGARAYIVKSDFDQEQLLEAIRRLTG
jgi:two-component system chemotaxis sensor kinase CheA